MDIREAVKGTNAAPVVADWYCYMERYISKLQQELTVLRRVAETADEVLPLIGDRYGHDALDSALRAWRRAIPVAAPQPAGGAKEGG